VSAHARNGAYGVRGKTRERAGTRVNVVDELRFIDHEAPSSPTRSRRARRHGARAIHRMSPRSQRHGSRTQGDNHGQSDPWVVKLVAERTL